MHKIARRATVVAAVGSAALGLAVSTTMAAPQATWTVAPGGAVTAHADNPAVVTDSGEYGCTSADGTGSVKSGSGLSGAGIGQLDTLTFEGCKALGLDLEVTLSDAPYAINVTGVHADNPDWVNGEVANIKAHIQATGCSADFTGTVKGYFDNTNGTLVSDGTSKDLVASNASCLGLINDGDTAAIKAVIQLDPAQKITLDG